uniref:Uncharacterized protein n=1 Tax=Panagrolaimus sp. PS1159 TaxID=55785 RepID=A0AC35F2E7_9BILA
MATKDFEEKSGFVNSNEDYGFQKNLIQAYKCSLIDSIQIERKNTDDSDPYETKRNKNDLWKNELKPYLTQFASEEKSQKGWKNENVTSANANSALSLHITAYENFIEASNSDNFETKKNKSRKENKNEKTWKNVKQIFARTFASSFEIPRQKEDQIMSEPEIMQFKATQKLLDPNQLNFVENSSGFDKSKDSNLKSKWNSSNASKTSIQSVSFTL